MKLNKVLFPVVLLVMAGIAMMGCSNPAGSDPKSRDISWTAAAIDNADGDTTIKIRFTFSDAVTGLKKTDITISEGTGKATKGDELKAADNSKNKIWELDIDVTQGGGVSVNINKAGVKTDSQTVTVKIKAAVYVPSGEWDDVGQPTTSANGIQKIWTIKADVITAMKAAKTGSKLRLYFTAPENRHGYGIGSIGADGENGIRFDLAIPDEETGTEFYIDVWVAWLLHAIGNDGTLTVITWFGPNGETPPKDQNYPLVKIALIEPDGAVVVPSIPGAPDKPKQKPMADYVFVREVSTTSGGEVNLSTGKGNIEGDDFTAIKEAPEGSMLRFYVRNMSDPYSSRSGWNDVGTVGGTTAATRLNISGAGDTGGKDNRDFIWDVPVANVLAKIGEAAFIFVNPYNACIVTMCELWKPDEAAEPGWNLEIPKDEWSSNYQVLLDNSHYKLGSLFKRQIYEGDVYKLVITFKSDTDIPELGFGLIDNSAAASWWKELSAREKIENITAGEEVTKTLTITATAASSGFTDIAANKLIIAAGEIGRVVTLRVLEFTFSRTTDGEAPPPPTFEFPTFSDATILEDQETGQWGFEHRLEAFKAAKYIVIASVAGESGNAGGFGGMQFGIQGNGTDNWNLASNLLYTGDWTTITRAEDQIVYVVIDVTGFPNYTTLMSDATNIQFVINHGKDQLGDEYKVYITDKTLTKPGDAVEANGSNSTANGKIYFSTTVDLEEVAGYSPTLTADGFFYLGGFTDSLKTWNTNGVDGASNSFTEAILASAKYLIVEVHTSSLNGAGGLGLAHQGGTNSGWTWQQTDLCGWTTLQPTLDSYGTDHTFYIVVDLSTIPHWTETRGGGGAKVILAYPDGWSDSHMDFKAGYLTSLNLTKPGVFVDLGKDGTTYGWFALDVSEGH